MRAGTATIGVGSALVALALGWWSWQASPPLAPETHIEATLRQHHPPGQPRTQTPVVPAPPAPRAPQPLGVPELLSLPMPDGSPLRVRWYGAQNVAAPVIVLDAGAGPPLPPWEPLLMALLAQRPAHILWLDDMQAKTVDPLPRALARWQSALLWLDTRAPAVRAVLLGAGEAAAVIPRLPAQVRPLSVALVDPRPVPETVTLRPMAEKFALVCLPDGPTPTWVGALHNAQTRTLARPDDPHFAADVAGWLFAALGPR